MFAPRSHYLLLSLVSVALLGQPTPKDAAKQAPAQVKKQTPPPPEAAPAKPLDESQFELLEHVKYPYKPTLVRDPFSSPSDNADKDKAESVDDIGVLGWVVIRGKPLAIVSDSRGKTRQLPVGYTFKDGVIVSISEKAVVFRQWDPTATSRTGKIVEKPFQRKEGKQ